MYKLGSNIVLLLIVNSERIAMLWKDEIKFSILNFSKYHVHAKINCEDENKMEWFIMGVYRKLETNYRT